MSIGIVIVVSIDVIVVASIVVVFVGCIVASINVGNVVILIVNYYC